MPTKVSAAMTEGVVKDTDKALSTGSSLTAQNGKVVQLGTNNTVDDTINPLYTLGGIQLGGSGAANLLDDYEIGTYTIAMTAATSGTITLDSGFNTGYYTKVGDIVTVTGNPKISSVSSPTGTTLISLPFAVKNEAKSNAVGPMLEAGVTYQANQTGGFMVLSAENTATMTILYNTDGDFFGLQAQNAGFGANDQFRFSITYKSQ
tara:strand:+ start:285 stop:899 length:615 start_codon:yes stop_codon:yes gene_type:complete